MKKIKIILWTFLPALVVTPVLFSTSCSSKIAVTSIQVTVPFNTLGYNNTMQCTATVSPSNATNKNVVWSVDDNNLGSITSDGKFSSKSNNGFVTIKATATDGSGVYGKQTIEIKDIKITSLSVRATPFKANINSEVYCVATITPANASNKDLDWSIDQGETFATIDANTGKVSINGTPTTGDVIKVATKTKNSSQITKYTTITIDTTADTDDYETYIHDRSFSLLGSGIKDKYRYMAWGTCWIFADATPDNLNDYQYYIATNWHVVLGHQSVEGQTSNFHMYFGDDTKSSGLKILSDYTQFTSYSLEPESNFYYTSRTQAIDFYVAKADFSSASSDVKAKLNKLNTRQKNYGAITEFAPTVSDSSHALPTNMYIGGYPVQNKYYATWETHTIDPIEDGMTYYKYEANSHRIDEDGKYVDKSPQYRMSVNKGSDWMIGGASGSMLLGKADSRYKVYGIYWGGWASTSSSAFWPAFSIFNSAEKNFVERYFV